VVREHLDTRWEDPDKLMPPSAKTREETHSRAVKDIAEDRLTFSGDEFPMPRTHVNVPEPSFVVPGPGGAQLVPDIVVAEFPGDRPLILAAVETVDTVTDEQAATRWRPFSQVRGASFRLYVPSGFAAEAKRLLKKHRIKNVRLRTWRYVAGLGQLDITHIHYGGILGLLLPPFLLGRRGY
jgi:hypothetical protein